MSTKKITNIFHNGENYELGGEEYTAGEGIDITNNEIGLNGTYSGEYKDYSAMQGPCASGFHVPTFTEWTAVKTVWTSLGGGNSDGSSFSSYLKLPLSGFRGYYTDVYYQGTEGYYWSCSTSSNKASILDFKSSFITPSTPVARTNGCTIRPFKDVSVVPTSSRTKLYGTSIEAGGIFWSSDLGLISLSSDGTTWITIADKNLGATQVYSGGALSETNCGGYFQRGNNYMFPFTGTISNTSTTRVNASTYGPGNYYYSNTFIKDDTRRDSSNNDNLRGGVTGVVQETISGNLILGGQFYKIVTSTTAPASGTASNVITIVTD